MLFVRPFATTFISVSSYDSTSYVTSAVLPAALEDEVGDAPFGTMLFVRPYVTTQCKIFRFETFFTTFTTAGYGCTGSATAALQR